MAVFNAAKKEIDIKIVYYGPALCGKTTNVQSIHKKMAPDQRGDIMSLATKDDRTLFFDFLPIELGDIKGFKTRFHVYTVPGQVYYALTRRAVLTGVDGVVFVADSQGDKLEENRESLKDLDDNLTYYKKDLTTVPFIMQYNKRDLDNIMTVGELNAALNKLEVPFCEASAVQGTGVVETLTACCKLILKQMDKSAKKKPRKATAGLSEKQEDIDEPIIKITSEEPAEVQAPETAEAESRDNLEMPSIEPLGLEELEPSAEAEPEIKIDLTEAPSGVPEPAGPSGDQPLSLNLEGGPGPDPVSLEEPAAAPSIGIQLESDAGFKIISCGQPEKVSDTSIRVPIVFKIEQLDKECTVNVSIKFDDFKLKG